MSHHTVLQLLSIVFLICVGIDLLIEFDFKSGIRLKWTYLWYVARYTAIICGVLLALDELFGV